MTKKIKYWCAFAPNGTGPYRAFTVTDPGVCDPNSWIIHLTIEQQTNFQINSRHDFYEKGWVEYWVEEDEL